jgi:hypothetical protein
MSDDPFAILGESLMVAPRRRKMAAAALKNVRVERDALKAHYHKAREEWVESTLAAHTETGDRLRAMLGWVNSLGPDDAEFLVHVLADEDWLLDAPKDLRFLALDQIHARIMKIKESLKQDPMADPEWPDGEPSAFQQCKALLSRKGVL